MDGLSILSNDVSDKDIVYSLLLVLSGILTDKNGKTIGMLSFSEFKISLF